jgi:ubiquinone/menaquinone biosynthesis C-methylase UbiE
MPRLGLVGQRVWNRRAFRRHRGPKSLFSIDPSVGFLAQAQANVPDRRVTFQVADAQALPLSAANKDVLFGFEFFG